MRVNSVFPASKPALEKVLKQAGYKLVDGEIEGVEDVKEVIELLKFKGFIVTRCYQYSNGKNWFVGFDIA